MPLYEYRCKKCGHQFEKIQSFSAPEEKECPVCHGEVERLLSAPAIQFKGSGWYVNDYAGSKGSAAKSSPEGSAKSGDSGQSGAKSGSAEKSSGSGSSGTSSSPAAPASSGSST